MSAVRCYLLLLLILVLAACSPSATVGFQLPFAPIKIKISERGELSVTAGGQYVTPLGTVTVEAGGKLPLDDPGPAGTTQLRIIRVMSDGRVAEHRYRLHLDNELAVCLDGRFHATFRGNVVTIELSSAVSKIVLMDPRDSQTDCPMPAATTTAPPQTPPPPPPSPQEIKDRYVAEAEQACYHHTSQKPPPAPEQPRPRLSYIRTIHTLRDREIVAWQAVRRPAEFNGSITAIINAHIAAHNAFGDLITAFDYAVRASESRANTSIMAQANKEVDEAGARYRRLNDTAVTSARSFGFSACSHSWY
jgi:hypothetical protein